MLSFGIALSAVVPAFLPGHPLLRASIALLGQSALVARTQAAAKRAGELVWHLPLPLGVAGHEGSTILVALNGLRLLRRGAWAAAPPTAAGRAPRR